jgi:hypothetical protein
MSTAPRKYPKWAVSAFTLALGAAVFAAHAIGGNTEEGAKSFVFLAIVAVVLMIGGSSETVRLIRQPDERWAALDKRATAFTGAVLVVVLVGAWLWEIAHGRDGQPYVGLCSLGGVAYISSMVWLRFRA